MCTFLAAHVHKLDLVDIALPTHNQISLCQWKDPDLLPFNLGNKLVLI